MRREPFPVALLVLRTGHAPSLPVFLMLAEREAHRSEQVKTTARGHKALAAGMQTTRFRPRYLISSDASAVRLRSGENGS
jgi:hypothetical protein